MFSGISLLWCEALTRSSSAFVVAVSFWSCFLSSSLSPSLERFSFDRKRLGG